MFWPSTRVWMSCSEANEWSVLLVRQRFLREVVGHHCKISSQMSGGKTPDGCWKVMFAVPFVTRCRIAYGDCGVRQKDVVDCVADFGIVSSQVRSGCPTRDVEDARPTTQKMPDPRRRSCPTRVTGDACLTMWKVPVARIGKRPSCDAGGARLAMYKVPVS